MSRVKLLLFAALLLANCAAEVSTHEVEAEQHTEALGPQGSVWTNINSNNGKPFGQESNRRLATLRNYMQRFNPVGFSCAINGSGNADCSNANSFVQLRECGASPPGSAQTRCFIYVAQIWGWEREAAAFWLTGSGSTNYLEQNPDGSLTGYWYSGWFGNNSLTEFLP